MAYKPKYAQNGKKKEPDIIRQEVQPAQKPQPKQEQPRQKSKGVMALFIILGILIVPAASWATAALMGRMFENLGRPKESTVAKTGDMAILENFEAHVAQELTGTRNLLLNVERPENTGPAGTEEAPEEELAPVRKVYWIEDDVQVAPEPDQTRFGKTDDPEVMQWVLDEAKWLLEGQTTYFRPDMPRYEDSSVHYYLDDSILALTWQEVHDGSVYTFSEIKVSHPSQFRRHLAGGEYGSDMQYLTTEMAASVNAVVASAGDFYRFRDFGAVVYQGEAKRVEGTYAETCYIDSKGDMHFTYGGDVLTVNEVQAFVDEHDIRFSLAFGPILVQDYEIVDHTWYGVGEINEGYARAALCQMDELHYIVVAANTTGAYQDIPTVKTFARHVAATGCKHAYCLDGGQTATIVMNDELMNRPVYGQQRKISDIIYFATAVPEGG